MDSSLVHPIIKWVGGKRQLLQELLNNLPNFSGRYYEPFAGGCALLFALKPENAYISDINEELINLYKIVKGSVEELIKDLKKHINTKEYFLNIRDIDLKEEYKNWSNIQRASRFIYLNKTCFNGLYRVNSKGHFNVPFGNYKNPKIIDEENLTKCSRLLQKVEIKHADFEEVLKVVRQDDFVYFDPPYIPISQTSNFTSYTKQGFDFKEQLRLKEVCDKLNSMKVKFLLSNSDTELTRDLYSYYDIIEVVAPRVISAKASSRGKVKEVLVKNY